jgi:hypothetical protein
MAFKLDHGKSFFDSRAVQKALDKGTRKALSRYGGVVRKTAQRSMRKAPQRGDVDRRTGRAKKIEPSPPGQPPRSRVGFIRKFLFYVWDDLSKSVVIGPIAFGKRRPGVPELHEEGGVKVVNKERLVYPARPFMQPAHDAMQDKLPQFFKDCMKP